MTQDDWLQRNSVNFGSEYERLFAKTVLPLVSELNTETISLQYPFRDRDGRQRYCDFVINENDYVRIAIEIDGYDKRGTGEGMSHADFVDWQRRQATLTSLGWHVLRFANRDVREDPRRCAEHISLLLKYARGKYQQTSLSDVEEARLHALTKAQNNTIEHLAKESSAMKLTIASFTTVIVVLILIIVWQSNKDSPKQPTVIVQNPTIPPQPATATTTHNTYTKPNQPSTPVNVARRYSDVLTSAGITCWDSEDADGSHKEFPGLGKDEHFFCPCTTDMSCVVTNPHLGDLTDEPDLNISKAPKGTTCANPINWEEANQHIGQTWVIVGPVTKITQRDNVRGNPLWVDIGATYPNAQRLMLIIWGKNSADFPMVKPGQLEGKRVCVVGKIDAYKGIPQIELKNANQFMVAK